MAQGPLPYFDYIHWHKKLRFLCHLGATVSPAGAVTWADAIYTGQLLLSTDNVQDVVQI